MPLGSVHRISAWTTGSSPAVTRGKGSESAGTPARRLGVVPLFFLRARALDALDLDRRPAGFFGDIAVLLDQEFVRRLVAIDAGGQRARHLAVRALRAVFVDYIELL